MQKCIKNCNFFSKQTLIINFSSKTISSYFICFLVNKLTGKVTPSRRNLLTKNFFSSYFPSQCWRRENKNREEKSLKLLLDSPEPTPISRESWNQRANSTRKIHSSSFINIRLTRESWKQRWKRISSTKKMKIYESGLGEKTLRAWTVNFID